MSEKLNIIKKPSILPIKKSFRHGAERLFCILIPNPYVDPYEKVIYKIVKNSQKQGAIR